MKKTLFLALGLASLTTYAQNGKVGINTISPSATLDIKPSEENKIETATTNEGILIPRLSKERVANMAEPELSLLVFVNNVAYTPKTDIINNRVANIEAVGFHYYDGTTWQPLQKPTPKFDYIVSADGRVLMQWMNKYTETVDMNQYADMKDVSVIGQSLLQGSSVKRFIVRDGVTTIGRYAFAENPNMEIRLPNSITTIEDNAFHGNNKLTHLNLPNATVIGDYAFSRVTSLTSVSLPMATTIGDNAFSGATSLTSVSLPKAITIGGNAFYGAVSLTSVSLPNATTIGDGAFNGATSLTSVSLPNVTTIGAYAFSETSLTSVSLPNVTTIGHDAFCGGASLTSVSLPNVITMEGDAVCAKEVIIGTKIQNLGNLYSVSNRVITIQALTPPRIGEFYPERGVYPARFRVPMASLEAYKTAWAGKVPEDHITGF